MAKRKEEREVVGYTKVVARTEAGKQVVQVPVYAGEDSAAAWRRAQAEAEGAGAADEAGEE